MPKITIYIGIIFPKICSLSNSLFLSFQFIQNVVSIKFCNGTTFHDSPKVFLAWGPGLVCGRCFFSTSLRYWLSLVDARRPELNQSAGSLLPCVVFMWLGSFIQLLLNATTDPSEGALLSLSPPLFHSFCLSCLSIAAL